MTSTLETDVAIIGAGTAGLNARREVKRAGRSVRLIDGGPLGTTCARVGCMPSKLLIHAADVAEEIRHADAVGIETGGPVRIDGQRVLARVRRERDRFAGFVVEAIRAFPEGELLRGNARFIGPTTLEVEGGIRVEAKAVVIATGSESFIIPPLRGLGKRLLLNDDLFELETLPESIAVIGSGVIGLELGQALHRLGVRTKVFSNVLLLGPMSDPVVCEKTQEVFGLELELRLEVDIFAAQERDDGVSLNWRDKDGNTHEEHFDYVLCAAGRIPRLKGLDLPKSGIAVDEKGRPIFDPQTQQCGDAPVFVAGDVSNYRPFLHEAADEGNVAGANAARFPDVLAQARRTALAIVFTDPQMGVVGTPFSSLPLERTAIGEVSYDDQGRARVIGKNAGHVRVYADRDTKLLVGAEMFGPRVEHTAHLLAWAIQQRLTVCAALAMPFYHPVFEEGIRTALRDLAANLRLQAKPGRRDLDCGPGA